MQECPVHSQRWKFPYSGLQSFMLRDECSFHHEWLYQTINFWVLICSRIMMCTKRGINVLAQLVMFRLSWPECPRHHDILSSSDKYPFLWSSLCKWRIRRHGLDRSDRQDLGKNRFDMRLLRLWQTGCDGISSQFSFCRWQKLCHLILAVIALKPAGNYLATSEIPRTAHPAEGF